ncbi:MAG TPA: hypothetical protein DCE41_28185, partial [Cytophagales bacterium]|nr:hypothetical protein [Cytophagales bacterium]
MNNYRLGGQFWLFILLLLCSVSKAYSFQITDYVITNANAGGAGSFQDAMQAIDGQPGEHRITFDVSLAGQTVPYHTDTVTLEGSLSINGDVDGDNILDITFSGTSTQGIIFSLDNDITIDVRHVKYQGFEGLNGYAFFWIRNRGTIVVDSCVFEGIERPVIWVENWTDIYPTHITINSSRFSNMFDYGIFRSVSTPESTITMRNCIVANNNSPRSYLLWSGSEQVLYENCLIVDNVAEQVVYAIGNESSLTMRHCTIANNLVDPSIFDPGTIYAFVDSVNFFNTLIVGNTNIDRGNEETYSTKGSQTILDTAGSILFGPSTGYFVNPSQGDYTLAAGSPALDAGDSTVIGTLTSDLADNLRPVDLPDVGAYEFFVAPPSSDPSLVLALNLDTCAGTQLVDSISGENVGEYRGTASWSSGYQNQGIALNGTDNQAVLSDSAFGLDTSRAFS